MSPRRAFATGLGVVSLAALAACGTPPATPPATPTPTTSAPSTGCPAAAPEMPEDGVEVEGSPLGLAIERVCLYGVDDETRGMVETSLALKVGQPLSAEATRTSLDQITKLELFEDVRLGAETHGTSATVHVVVAARPRIEGVVFEPETSKRDLAPDALGHRADPRRLRVVAAQLEEALHQEGRGNARVAMTIEPTRPGSARVRVTIDAGPVWTIARLSFPGAKAIAEGELQAATEIKPGSFWNGETIGRAGAQLTSLYFDRGYINVKVAEPAQSVDASGNVTLAWAVDEGGQYTLGKVTFKGKLAASMQGELRKGMKSRVGAPFSRTVLMTDMARMREQLAQRGHRADVTPLTDIDPKRKSLAVTLEISEGDRAP